jgi:hypothetical protein
MASKELAQELAQAETEHATYLAQAETATGDAMTAIGGTLAALGARVAALKRRLAEALDFERKAQAQAEAQRQEAERQAAIAALRVRQTDLQAALEAWQTALGTLDSTAAALWERFVVVQHGIGELAHDAQALGIDAPVTVPPCDIVAEVSGGRSPRLKWAAMRKSY